MKVNRFIFYLIVVLYVATGTSLTTGTLLFTISLNVCVLEFFIGTTFPVTIYYRYSRSK